MVRNKAASMVCSELLLLGLLAIASPWTATAEKGHRVVGSSVVVEGAQHWEQWQIPANLAFIDSLGRVAPRSFRTVYNLLADTTFKRPLEIFSKDVRIATIDSTARRNDQGELLLDTQENPIFDYFVRPGVSRVGSNPEAVNNIFDGDPSTYWEPDPNDPISDWWIEVDLGRVVPLERLRLEFVDEKLGDPFLKFVLLMSERQTPGRFEEGNLRFQRIIPFEAANVDQRVFVFQSGGVSDDLPPADVAVEEKLLAPAGVATGRHQSNYVASQSNLEWTGRKAETIRIVITDSRLGRAEQISEDQWAALPEGERGDIIYHVTDLSGREEPVDEDTYQGLATERQGRREYFRRELPRLAEVEAWGWGDNLSLGLAKDGGAISHTFLNAAPIAAFDGDGATRYKHAARDPEKPDDNIMVVDMGGSIWLDQIRYFSDDDLRGYLMRGSSGARDAQGELVWQAVSPVAREKNVDNGWYTTINDVLIKPVKLRFLELTTFVNANVEGAGHSIDNYWPWISEIQIFSRGPAAEVVIESDLVSLPGNHNLGAIEWMADTPPGTEVEIRTRTGNQLYEIVRYFKNSGESQTAEEYAKLPGFLKGATDTSLALGPDWSAWSQSYGVSGSRVTSPSLRSYMQIQARLISNVRTAAPSLARISVQLHDPIAQQLGAEIWPAEAAAGVLDTFSVFLKPAFVEEPAGQRQAGFDEVLLRSEPRWDMYLLDVAIGSEEEFAKEAPPILFELATDLGLAAMDGDEIQVLKDQSDSVWVRFPHVLKSDVADDRGRTYYRKLQAGDEVPLAVNGETLTGTSYALLPLEEKGAIRYFRLLDDQGRMLETDAESYGALPMSEQGPIRYFRVSSALGDISRFNALGEQLTLDEYNDLDPALQDIVVGDGDLIRMRFASRIYVQGSNLKVAVRSSSGADLWQEAQADDVTSVKPGRTLEIKALGGQKVVDSVDVFPNPFTPNNDGINDRTEIQFTLYKLHQARPITVSIFRLDGRRVRDITVDAAGGQLTMKWDGRDNSGELVVPGLYVITISAEADAARVAGKKSAKLIGVAY